MLENQILRLRSAEPKAFEFLLTQLNLKSAPPDQKISRLVLREGFTTTDPGGFIREFKTKLRRYNRIHKPIRGTRTSHDALGQFIAHARDDCKLSLARYLFKPAEVVEEILRQVRITEGVRDIGASESRHVKEELQAQLALLPSFEASVLNRLRANGSIYWVSDKTRSQINSLVEYPLTTVVLVIKLPGSDLEFEIKRAGRRGPQSLNIVYERGGLTVPPSHRLDGGSMGSLLRYESNHGAKFAAVYRLVHGSAAPVGTHASRSNINTVPTQNGRVRILSYFTEPRLFGEGFRGMRIAMKESVKAFRSEGSAGVPEIPGDLGLSAQFIGQTAPAQALIVGTSSFRLDKLAAYLARDGVELYFREGLGVAYSNLDAKAFADALLEEVLGACEPAGVRYNNHDQYITAVLSQNRARADEVYLSLTKQLAKFWGTMLAVRAYSAGESLVARNVGLKSFWHQGKWDVKLIFLDHDALVIPNPRNGHFFAHGDIPNMRLDERHVWGRWKPERFAASDVGCLQKIYRVNQALDLQGETLARAELKAAYVKTQRELLTNPALQRLFSKNLLKHLRDWDVLVDGYLQLNGDKAAASRWRRKMKSILTAKGYKKDMLAAYIGVIERNKEFLTEYRFLFSADTDVHSNVSPS
ncbi:MAG TPA: hypothetical protein VLL54_20615 [Pyrinomonadaceae bacterium]|nr:hypothetical protein [Pyrinomonadaceae bacterium]